MRLLSLSKSGINKIRGRQMELKAGDFEDSIKSLPPGEWCCFQLSPNETWAGYVNSQMDERYSCAHAVGKFSQDEMKNFLPEAFITSKLNEAYEKRKRFKGYEKNCRLFYGASDGLPGLIIDLFENACIVQINSAGVDRYRDHVKQETARITGTAAYFLDNAKYREKEFLPVYESEELPELIVVENSIRYVIRPEVLQKVGFYFDHRENRFQLTSLLGRLEKRPALGADLFCYAGAWGMSALTAGAAEMHFVDQGDFGVEVEAALKINEVRGKGSFYRQDVFKFLDEAAQKKTKYDLILCDPPAFAKSALQKSQALEGYSKLHRKVFKALEKGSLAAFSSCTHYVSHEEFQKNILDAASRENRRIQLVYSGIQGFDHPVSSQSERSNYIKSYFYIVE